MFGNRLLNPRKQMIYKESVNFIVLFNVFFLHTYTFTQRLCVIPVGVSCVYALNDRRALLQRMARFTGKLYYGSHTIGWICGAKVSILDVWLIAVALLKSCLDRITKACCEWHCGGFMYNSANRKFIENIFLNNNENIIIFLNNKTL